MQRLGVSPDAATRSHRVAATAWKIAAVLAFAVIAGLAIMLQVRGWSALEGRSGGACGAGTGPCPDREVPGLVVSFVAGLIAVPVIVRALVRRPKVNVAAVVIGVAAGVFAGQALSGWAYGTQLRVDWAAPSSGELTSEGVWTTAGSLIRVGTGQLVSYDVGTGRPLWTLAVPGGDAACAVSAQSSAPAIGLIGYGSPGGACDHMLAVDLGTGRPLWSRPVAAGWTGDQGRGFVAVGGDTAMAVTAGAVLSYDLRTGVPRWTALTPGGCSDQTLAAAQQSVVVLAACGRDFEVIDLDPASGTQVWRTTVSESAADYQFAILSADPVVVDDSLPGTPSAGQVLAFGADGHIESTIPVGSVALDTSDYLGSGPDVVVTDGLLTGLTRPSGGHSDVVAFRLSDGRLEWRVKMPDDALSLRQDGARLLVLDRSEPAAALDAITLSAGSLGAVGIIPRNAAGLGDAGVYPVGGRYLVVTMTGSTSGPPVAALSGLRESVWSHTGQVSQLNSSVHLVGRDRDVAVIRSFVDQAAAHGGALVVSGEAGVGKTVGSGLGGGFRRLRQSADLGTVSAVFSVAGVEFDGAVGVGQRLVTAVHALSFRGNPRRVKHAGILPLAVVAGRYTGFDPAGHGHHAYVRKNLRGETTVDRNDGAGEGARVG